MPKTLSLNLIEPPDLTFSLLEIQGTEEQVKLCCQEATSQIFRDVGTFTGQMLWFPLQIHSMKKKSRTVRLKVT